jgi:hypothetical protein
MHSVDQLNSLEPSHQSVLLPCYNADDLFPARLVGMLAPNTCVYLTVLFCTGAGRVRLIDIHSHSNFPHPYLPTFTMSTSRNSLHRHWKNTPPNSYVMGLIRQVVYDLVFNEDADDGMLDIYEVNILKPKDEFRTHWRRFPAAYFPFLNRFLYRFELYLDVHDVVHGSRGNHSFSKASVRCLKQYILYMNGVMMEAWDQCRAAGVAQELGADWRCPALDRWLNLEFHVKRHDVKDVQLYIVQNSGSGLDEDPFELGMLDVYLHVRLFLYLYLAQIGLNTRHPFPTGITARGTIIQLQE